MKTLLRKRIIGTVLTLGLILILGTSSLATTSISLQVKGSWPRVWKECQLQDPKDFNQSSSYNPLFPRVSFKYYTSFFFHQNNWYSISDCLDELCLAKGPTPCQQEIIAQKTNLNRNPGDFFRAWWFISTSSGIIGLGGVSTGPYGVSPGYPIHRIVATSPESSWILSSSPVVGLNGVSTSGGPMALFQHSSGELWYYPTFVSKNKTTGFTLAISNDLGASWTALRDNTGQLIDLRPSWMFNDSWVFSRAQFIDDIVHLWLTRWRRNWAAGQVHLVSKDGVTFTNYNPRSSMEFGTIVGKGVVPLYDKTFGLAGLLPHKYGYFAKFNGE